MHQLPRVVWDENIGPNQHFKATCLHLKEILVCQALSCCGLISKTSSIHQLRDSQLKN
uniref:Uncharacterized protein n=1 Tax=Rhizophora mucronata TaxID=61149 RepID=A0A2P2MY18_RHIMU